MTTSSTARSEPAPGEDTVDLFSDEWYRAFERLLTEAVAARADELRDVAFSMCEITTDCPGGGDAAHWFEVKNGVVQFGHGTRDDVDSRLTVDYETVLPVAKSEVANIDPSYIEAAVAAGKYEFEGVDMASLAPALMAALHETHDRLAKVTS